MCVCVSIYACIKKDEKPFEKGNKVFVEENTKSLYQRKRSFGFLIPSLGSPKLKGA